MMARAQRSGRGRRYPSLAEQVPSVAAQWHPSRNLHRYRPDVVSRGAQLLVWWRCGRGHEWEEKVCTRTSAAPRWKKGDPAACPFCVPSPAVRVDHTFACGHTAKVSPRLAQTDPPRCPGCGPSP